MRCGGNLRSTLLNQFLPMVPAAAPSRASRRTNTKLQHHRPIEARAGLGHSEINRARRVCVRAARVKSSETDRIDYD